MIWLGTACAGDPDESAPAPTTAMATSFEVEASAICAQARVGPDGPAPSTNEENAAALELAAATTRQAVESLRGLDSPDAALYDDWLDGTEAAAGHLDAAAAALRAGDASGAATALQAAEDASKAVAEIPDALGISSCRTESSPGS